MRKFFIIIFLSALFTLIPVTIVWTHHYFVTGLNPFSAIIITPFILVIAILISLSCIRFFKKYISFTPDVLFSIGVFSCFGLIFVLKYFYGGSALDIHLHDKYFITSYTRPLFWVAIVFAIFGAAYYWFDKIFKRQLNYTLGYIHFWISFLATIWFLLPMQYVPPVGMPRRYYDYGGSYSVNVLFNHNEFIAVLAVLVVLAQLLFVFNLCNSILRKPK